MRAGVSGACVVGILVIMKGIGGAFFRAHENGHENDHGTYLDRNTSSTLIKKNIIFL